MTPACCVYRPALAVLLAVLGSFAPSTASAFALPTFRGPVNDQAALLSPDERRELEAELRAYQQRTQHQFVLLVQFPARLAARAPRLSTWP
jgi:uncharacterized membrane protein YgcG